MKKKITIQQILAALVGVFCASIGVAFNNLAGWGNDSVGMLYDGIRSFFGMPVEQLGLVSNGVNIVLIIFLLIFAGRYVSIGTIVYLLPYGFFVDIGTHLYPVLFPSDFYLIRILGSIVGCLLICIGIAIYIVLDIGVDPFTGIVLFLRDKTKIEYGYLKIAFDFTLIVIGALLGGRLGAVTFITAMVIGPTVQFLTERLNHWAWFQTYILRGKTDDISGDYGASGGNL